MNQNHLYETITARILASLEQGVSYVAPVYADLDTLGLRECVQAFGIEKKLRYQQRRKQHFQGRLHGLPPIRLWDADQRFMAPMSQQKGHEAYD